MQARFNGIQKRAITFVLIQLSLMLMGCQSAVHERLPTGVERSDGPDGSIRLIATAMASQKAIDADKVTMMQTTSREAARLLLLVELKKPEYEKIREGFETGEVEFIERGLYCRMISVYTPPKPVSPPHPRPAAEPTR